MNYSLESKLQIMLICYVAIFSILDVKNRFIPDNSHKHHHAGQDIINQFNRDNVTSIIMDRQHIKRSTNVITKGQNHTSCLFKLKRSKFGDFGCT